MQDNLFKTFHIDYDKLTVDDIVIHKPNYISAIQWLNFWERLDEAVIDNLLSKSFDEGYKHGENDTTSINEDHNKGTEIEIRNMSDRLQAVIFDEEKSREDIFDTLCDEVDKLRKEIWRS